MGKKKNKIKRKEVTVYKKKSSLSAILKRRFDWWTFILLMVITISAIFSNGSNINVTTGEYESFTVWFLLVLGYFPLELLLLFNKLFPIPLFNELVLQLNNNPVAYLALIDAIIIAIIWAVIRFFLSKRYPPSFMQAAKVFVMILALWGVFQLLCGVFASNWEDRTIENLYLKDSKNENNIITKLE